MMKTVTRPCSHSAAFYYLFGKSIHEWLKISILLFDCKFFSPNICSQLNIQNEKARKRDHTHTHFFLIHSTRIC
ncbi:hypothetical protein GDO81_005744 [Engystomops pustulosus]|uniref:Uncharacterized protein n=1 Tax=Engystomops pustulosus TaxID=76066 RepID=A0AAV7CS61_ENGPU|nr:hypothetical protein GDO81_005744 [Engystomops pustulosus]